MTTKVAWRSDLTDTVLVKYLKSPNAFSYFGRSTRGKVKSLDAKILAVPGEDPVRGGLMELWRLVLTDALRELKRHDPREWRKGAEIHFDSFFNEESLGVPKLEAVVKAFTRFESLMYGASPERYRDHVGHSFRVWIIGHRLLREALSGTLETDAPEKGKDCLEIKAIEWECMWALTALCHDIGYPLSMVEAINARAKESLQQQGLRSISDLRFSFSREMQPFYETVMELMSSKVVPTEDAPEEAAAGSNQSKVSRATDRHRFLTHLQNKYYLKFLNAFDLLDHGVISALLTAKSLVYFLESDLCKDSRSPLEPEDARQFLIRREILRAIASHHCPDIYHLKFNTLSFLLYIVDELQEPGRPTLEEGYQVPLGSDKVAVKIRKFGEKSIDVEITKGSPWRSCRKGIADLFRGMKRRLRLAAGTAEMKKDMRLIFAVKTKDQDAELSLKKGRIACIPPLESRRWTQS